MPACRLWTDSVLRAGGRAPFVRIGLLMNSKCLYGLKLELRSHWALLALERHGGTRIVAVRAFIALRETGSLDDGLVPLLGKD